MPDSRGRRTCRPPASLRCRCLHQQSEGGAGSYQRNLVEIWEVDVAVRRTITRYLQLDEPLGPLGGVGEDRGCMVASLDRKCLGPRERRLGKPVCWRAEAFSIRRLEGSRWRLRRTRVCILIIWDFLRLAEGVPVERSLAGNSIRNCISSGKATT